MRIPSGKTDQVIYFVARSAATRSRLTGLSSFTVYRSRNGGAATVYTTPTVAELSAANTPGLYALTIDEDTSIASTSDSEEYTVHITATNMVSVTRTVELYRRDTTSGKTALIDSNGRVDVAAVAGTAQTGRDIGASVLVGDKTGFSLTQTFPSNFSALGITAGGHITNTDTLTTYTGNTPQTGDAYARVGAAGAGLTAIGDTRIANLDAAVSTRSTFGGGAVASVTADVGITQAAADKVWGSAARTLTSFGTLVSDIATAVWSAATRILTAGTNIVLAKGTGVTGFNDLDAAGVRTATGLASANLDTQLSGINAKTTNLPASPADESLIIAATTALAGSIAALPTMTTVNAIKDKTDNLPPAPAATGDIPTSIQNADALLDHANGIETGWTVRQAWRVLLAVFAGKASGLTGTTVTFRDVNDSKDRVVATVDVDGDRSALTLDAT